MKVSAYRSFILCFATVPILLIAIYVVQTMGSRQPLPQKAAPGTSHSDDGAGRFAQISDGICVVSGLTGFHEMENWGVWSGEDPAAIALKTALSGRIKVHFIGYASRELTAEQLTINIGGVARTIALGRSPTTFNLEYELPRPAKEVILSGIKPQAPSSGAGQDSRKLGVGLVRLGCEAE